MNRIEAIMIGTAIVLVVLFITGMMTAHAEMTTIYGPNGIKICSCTGRICTCF